MSQDTFCVNPWMTLHYQFDGTYLPCCQIQKPYRANSIQEYASSQELFELKQALLSNQRHPQCQKCWTNEDRGIVSKRQRDTKTYQKLWELKYRKNPMKEYDDFAEYYVRLGNHCNLRCTMCNDYLSSGWISEKKKYNIPSREIWLISQKDPIWDYIKRNSKYTKAIEFIGGEPFMMLQEEQCDLLDYLIDTGDCRHIILKYNTNGTRMSQDIVSRWKHFRTIELNVSMDGVKDRFHYLRYPGSWELFEDTLRFYQECSRENPNIVIMTLFTTSVLSMGYVGEYLDYCRSRSIKTFLNPLHDPRYLNIFNTSEKIKKWLISRIDEIDDLEIQSIKRNLGKFTEIDYTTEMISVLEDLDRKRNLDFRSTFPELARMLDD